MIPGNCDVGFIVLNVWRYITSAVQTHWHLQHQSCSALYECLACKTAVYVPAMYVYYLDQLLSVVITPTKHDFQVV